MIVIPGAGGTVLVVGIDFHPVRARNDDRHDFWEVAVWPNDPEGSEDAVASLGLSFLVALGPSPIADKGLLSLSFPPTCVNAFHLLILLILSVKIRAFPESLACSDSGTSESRPAPPGPRNSPGSLAFCSGPED